MRKFRLLSLLLLAIAFITVNCTKEGPEGPAGATGAQGPAGVAGTPGAQGNQGIQGPAGTANVIYGAWVTEPGNWGADSTVPSLGSGGVLAKRFIVPTVSLTQSILDIGVILCYIKSGATGQNPVALPYTYLSATPANVQQLDYRAAVGKITYFLYFPNNAFAPIGVTNFNAGAQFRYILIPGGVPGGRSTGLGGTNYTAAQLKAMSYNEICALFNIPQ